MARPLSIGITAPYSGKGGFQTLERIVHHYDHIHTSHITHHTSLISWMLLMKTESRCNTLNRVLKHRHLVRYRLTYFS
jgi:cytochrome c peroxidase